MTDATKKDLTQQAHRLVLAVSRVLNPHEPQPGRVWAGLCRQLDVKTWGEYIESHSTDEAQEALELLRDALRRQCIDVRWLPGAQPVVLH